MLTLSYGSVARFHWHLWHYRLRMPVWLLSTARHYLQIDLMDLWRRVVGQVRPSTLLVGAVSLHFEWFDGTLIALFGLLRIHQDPEELLL